MSEKEANDLRCYAHEIIIKLWEDGKVPELELLKAHCERAIEEPAK